MVFVPSFREPVRARRRRHRRLHQRAHRPALHPPRLRVVELQDVLEHDHAFGADDQRERLAQRVQRGRAEGRRAGASAASISGVRRFCRAGTSGVGAALRPAQERVHEHHAQLALVGDDHVVEHRLDLHEPLHRIGRCFDPAKSSSASGIGDVERGLQQQRVELRESSGRRSRATPAPPSATSSRLGLAPLLHQARRPPAAGPCGCGCAGSGARPALHRRRAANGATSVLRQLAQDRREVDPHVLAPDLAAVVELDDVQQAELERPVRGPRGRRAARRRAAPQRFVDQEAVAVQAPAALDACRRPGPRTAPRRRDARRRARASARPAGRRCRARHRGAASRSTPSTSSRASKPKCSSILRSISSRVSAMAVTPLQIKIGRIDRIETIISCQDLFSSTRKEPRGSLRPPPARVLGALRIGMVARRARC